MELRRTSGVKILLLALIFVTAACAEKSIIVTQGSPEVKGGYKGSCVLGDTAHSNSVLDSLCSGDLERILDHTSLTFIQRDELIEITCGEGASPRKVYEFYSSLPDFERGEMIRAFELYGYHLHGYG